MAEIWHEDELDFALDLYLRALDEDRKLTIKDKNDSRIIALTDYLGTLGYKRSRDAVFLKVREFLNIDPHQAEKDKIGYTEEDEKTWKRRFNDAVITSLMKQVIDFRDARNWAQFHNLKDLAISLSLEASELLELFQWKTCDDAVTAGKEKMADELADVMVYALTMCHQLDFEPEKIIRQKLEKNCAKYPVEKAYGSSKKYSEL